MPGGGRNVTWNGLTDSSVVMLNSAGFFPVSQEGGARASTVRRHVGVASRAFPFGSGLDDRTGGRPGLVVPSSSTDGGFLRRRGSHGLHERTAVGSASRLGDLKITQPWRLGLAHFCDLWEKLFDKPTETPSDEEPRRSHWAPMRLPNTSPDQPAAGERPFGASPVHGFCLSQCLCLPRRALCLRLPLGGLAKPSQMRIAG